MSNQEVSNKNTKRILSLSILLIMLVTVLFFVFKSFNPKTAKGAKNIVAQVILTDGTSKDFNMNTDQEFLRGALEEINLIKGDESSMGLLVNEVDGVQADSNKQEWWAFTKGGEFLNTGVDTTPIYDGDHFEITLTVGY